MAEPFLDLLSCCLLFLDVSAIPAPVVAEKEFGTDFRKISEFF